MFKKLFGSNQENTFESRVERLAKMEPLQRFAAASGYKNQFFAVLCPAVAGCAANAIIAVFTDDQLPALTKAKDSMRDEIIATYRRFLVGGSLRPIELGITRTTTPSTTLMLPTAVCIAPRNALPQTFNESPISNMISFRPNRAARLSRQFI